MMRARLLPLAVAVAAVAFHQAAYADQIRHPSGFTFELPNIGKAWAHETRGDVLYVSDDTDKVPELELFVFAPRKEAALADLVAGITTEVVRPGVQLFASKVTAARLVGSTANTAIADAAAVTGELTLNSRDRAAFAIVQRGGHSVILLAVPDAGIFERGAANFRAVLHGLGPGATAGAKPNPAASARPPAPGAARPPARGAGAPRLPDLVAIREVTATSTYADRKGMYAAWRTIDYDATYDEASQTAIPNTAWCEGKPDEGLGEAVTIAFAAPTHIDAMHVAAGVWKTQKLFAANNRIASLDIVVDGVPSTVKPPARRAWVDLPIGRAVSTVTVKIGAVIKGKMNDSCLSGIWFERKASRFLPVVGIDAAAAAALPSSVAAINDAFRKPALEARLDFPFSFRPGVGRDSHESRRVYASWRSLEAACKAQDEAEAKGIFRDAKTACPDAIAFDPDDTREVLVTSPALATLELEFPGKHEYRDLWRLRWHDGGWHLAAIDYRE